MKTKTFDVPIIGRASKVLFIPYLLAFYSEVENIYCDILK